MVFNSFQFIWLFPLIFVVNCLLLKITNDYTRTRVNNAYLLIASYLLYLQWSPAWLAFLLSITLITYFGAILLNRTVSPRQRKIILAIFTVLSLLPLAFFKYYEFLNLHIYPLLAALNIATEIPGLNLAIPLGISFYTFQALGYFLDVYKGEAKAEHNLLDYCLFVSFFPQLLAGPISTASELMPQIKGSRKFDYSEAVNGCKMLLWGFFLKVALADRIGTVVNHIVENYQHLSGVTCGFGAVMYSFQIYGDFAGYSLIAIGTARLLGFRLINNFNRPFLAYSITEFWRRWHISLSRWLTRHIYIPLGGSRCSKAKCYVNVLITFIVCGVWHGASLTFVVWGAIQGILIIIERMAGLRKYPARRWLAPRIALTFALVSLSFIIFRSETITDGLSYIAHIFTVPGGLSLTLPRTDLFLGIAFVCITMAKDVLNEYAPSISLLNNHHTIVRWGTYAILLSIIMLSGIFDSSSFIYAKF